MANRNSNARQADEASLSVIQKPCHQLYNWLEDGAESNADARFAATVLDVSRGTKVIASILCQHLVDLSWQRDDPENARLLLSGNDTEALARLMMFSLGQLNELADLRVEHFNAHAQAGGRA